MSAFIAGFLLGLSFIVAIGSQNAFVLRAGIRREHVFSIVLTCAVSDAILIAAGVAGFGVIVEAFPAVITGFRYFGAAFLAFYGAKSFLSALRGGEALIAQGAGQTWRSAIAMCLMFTWLNPHVYLDTVILLGATAQQYDAPWSFGFGATTASFFFFFSLGFGARMLSKFFANPRAWQILDALIGLTMWAIAFELVTSF
jgi:L-lysine exporter family protein LysE/ArgO